MLDAKQVQARDLPIRNAGEVDSVYANNFGLSTTNHDIAIHFTEIGREVGPTMSQMTEVHQVRAVIVLPKAVAWLLCEAIQRIAQAEHEAMRVQQQQQGSEPWQN